MSAANLTDPRSLWLNSSDALLQVLCVVAMNGHDARGFANLTRAFRGDHVLWGCIKDRRRLRGRTVLMACSINGDLARVRWLLERGANVNAQVEDGATSLILACFNGHLEVVRELLGRGANVNAARTSNGWTSLMAACSRGHLEIARLLLVHHASKATVNQFGSTAYDHTPAANAELRALVKP